MFKQLLFSAALAAVAISANGATKVLWQSEDPAGKLVGWGDPALSLTAEQASEIKVGDFLTMTVTGVVEDNGWPQVAIFQGNVGWPPTQNEGVGGKEYPYVASFGVTAEIADSIHAHGIVFKGDGAYVSEVGIKTSDFEVSPYAVWFGPKTCGWGNGVSISKETLANVAPFDKIQVEYDKEVADHTLQFLFGGWSGPNVPTYEAWKTNFLKVDETAGVMNLDLNPSLYNFTWGAEGEEKDYDLYALLKEGGLTMHGPCTLNQILYIPAKGGAEYNAILSEINKAEENYKSSLDSLMQKYPDYDFSEWEEVIGGKITEAKNGVLMALTVANEDDEEFNYPFSTEEIDTMVAEMNVKVPLYVDNQAAYDAVIAKADALQKKYNEAVEALTKEYPDADLSEWEEIIGGQINQAKSGAEQALNAANEDGEEFFFPFDGEEIEGMIEEMNAKVPLLAANQAAYEEVIAKLDALQKKYDDAVADIKKNNPDFDFSNYEEIGEYIESLKSWAAQALAAANEEGEEFFFPVGTDDIDAMIAMMLMDATPDPGFPETFTAKVSSENATVEIDKSQDVYTFVVSGVSAEKEVTVTVDVPEGWDGFVYQSTAEMEGNFGGEPLTRADDDEQIWAPLQWMLYEEFKEGNTLTFPADDEEYSASLMLYKGDIVYVKDHITIEFCVKYDATSGVAGVEAAENASYYDLQGNKISAPKAGMYVKVVDGKATKVVVK